LRGCEGRIEKVDIPVMEKLESGLGLDVEEMPPPSAEPLQRNLSNAPGCQRFEGCFPIRWKALSGLWLCAVLAMSPVRLGATVPNDSCLTALELTNGVPYTMSTTLADSDDPTNLCAVATGKGVWFKFTAARTGDYLLSSCGSSFDTVMQVYSGNCGTLSELLCNEGNGPVCYGTAASLKLSATAGSTYYVLVAGKLGASGSLNMLVIASMSNDECSTATPLSPMVMVTENTDGATFGGLQTSCQSNMGHDVWFSFSQASPGTVVFSTASSDYDTVLQLYTGPCNALVPVACNDDADPNNNIFTSALTNTIVANALYYIQVGGFAGTSGKLQLLVTPISTLGWSADATNLTLSWTAGSTLQMATNLNTPATWQDITTSGTYMERMTNKVRFFRLKN
jgi:hypothetical protein